MVEVFGILLMFIAFATAVDRVMLDEDKKNIAKFITKSANTKFEDFESSIITSAISVFTKKCGCLVVTKVLIYTGIVPFCFILIIHIVADEVLIDSIVVAINVMLASLYLSYISNYYSFYITKTIFWRKKRTPVLLIGAWLKDILLSVLVPLTPAVFGYITSLLYVDYTDRGSVDTLILQLVLLSVVLTLLTSICISLFQAVVIIIGVLLRLTIGPILSSLKILTIKTKISENPLTLIVLLATIVILFLKIAYEGYLYILASV